MIYIIEFAREDLDFLKEILLSQDLDMKQV